MSFYGKENEAKAPSTALPLRTYSYKRWGGEERVIEAHYVNFTAGHVNFWVRRSDDEQDTLIFSDVNAQITALKEVTE